MAVVRLLSLRDPGPLSEFFVFIPSRELPEKLIEVICLFRYCEDGHQRCFSCFISLNSAVSPFLPRSLVVDKKSDNKFHCSQFDLNMCLDLDREGRTLNLEISLGYRMPVK
jgi:hypothetical protein